MPHAVATSATDRYQGDFVAWNGGCVFIGEGGGKIAPHSHYAIQLVVGAPSGLLVQFGRRGDWQPTPAALVPSRAVHSIDVRDCGWCAVAFVEPETPEGRAISARLRGVPELFEASAVAVGAQRLERAWCIEKSADAVRSILLQWVRDLAGTGPREPTDDRVLAAIERLQTQLDGTVSLHEVATWVHLSPGRFRHLFVEQTGMPLRAYVLWRRLLRAWSVLMEGETLVQAAHAAGFADAAHLSRTCRTMFGLAPSAMQMRGPLAIRARQPHHKLG